MQAIIEHVEEDDIYLIRIYNDDGELYDAYAVDNITCRSIEFKEGILKISLKRRQE